MIVFLSIFLLSGCVKEKEQKTTPIPDQTQAPLTEEQKQLQTLLQNIETVITEQQNYTLSTSVAFQNYSGEHTLNLIEKFDLEHQSYEVGFKQKIGIEALEEGQEAFLILNNLKMLFEFDRGISSIADVKPYVGSYSNEALINLKMIKNSLPQSTVTIDDEGRYIVQQSLLNMIDPLKKSKIEELGLTYSELDTQVQFIFEYEPESNRLKVELVKELSNFNQTRLKYIMTFYNYGTTEINASVLDYNGKVGTSEESVLIYSDIENLFTISHTNYRYYKVKVSSPTFYRVEWESGHSKPYISYINKYNISMDNHEWIDDDAIYFEPGDYILSVNDSFRLIKEDYARHNDYQIDHSQTFTFHPHGQYDYSKLYIHTDPYNDRSYVKLKLSDNGRFYDSLVNQGKEQVVLGEDGFYYTNGGRIYLMSSDDNPVNVEVTYVDEHEKDEAPIIIDTYLDYFYTPNKYRDFISYHVLDIDQAGDYMISFKFFGDTPKANIMITDQYGNELFERDNHSILYLEPGMYYVYLNTENACFYQLKYTSIN